MNRQEPPPSPERSRIMSRIRSRDTKPEMAVRSHLHSRGLRFRLHRRDLPGTPDIVLPRYRSAVMVHGCFWHGHEGCFRNPRTRAEWWSAKIARNRDRDVAASAALAQAGWRVHVVWECQLSRSRAAETLDGLVGEITGAAP